ECAGARHADHRPPRAEVVAPLLAIFAGAADDQRIDRHVPAGARPFENLAGELVPEDQRRRATRITAVRRIEVSTADAYRLGANQNGTRRARWLRRVAVR